MFSLTDIAAGYADTPVLRDVTVDIAQGEFLGILGPNGCGKTTLLRVVRGTLPPRAGQVRVFGEDLGTIDRRRLATTIAYLVQDGATDFPFTVGELAIMGRTPHIRRFGRESQRDRRIAERAMRQADCLDLADRPVTELSGGQRQRAMIAMCLAQEPKILLLDEPTNHLDLRHQLSVLDLVGRLNREQRLTVVAVFHDLNLAAEYCHRLLLLSEGRIAALGRPCDVLTAETIRRIYGVTVAIQRNPISRKTHVIHAGAHAAVAAAPLGSNDA